MMQIGELFIALGFSVDNAKLKEFNDRIAAGTKAIGAMAAGAAAAVYGVNRFISSAVDQSVKLSNLNKMLGASTDEIKKLEMAGKQFNASFTLDDAIATYSKLWQMIQNAKDGEYPPELLRLNIGNIVGEDPIGLLNRIRDSRASYYDDQKWLDLVGKLGIGQAIPLLGASSSEFNNAMNVPTPSKEDIQAWVDVANAINKFKTDYDLLKMSMGQEISPHLIAFLENSRANLVLLGDAVSWVTDTWNGMSQASKNLTTFLAGLSLALIAIIVPFAWIPIGALAILAAWNKIGQSIRDGGWAKSIVDWVTKIPNAIDRAIDSLGKLFEKMKVMAMRLKDSALLKVLNLLVSEKGSKIADMKEQLQAAGAGIAKGIVPVGGIAEGRREMYSPKLSSLPSSTAKAEISTTVAPVYHLNTTASPQDMWNSIAQHERSLVQNAMMDNFYGAYGLTTGNPYAPDTVLRTR